ncbi:MAG: M48 family metallopeptidase [Rhizobiaceae bacterium]
MSEPVIIEGNWFAKGRSRSVPARLVVADPANVGAVVQLPNNAHEVVKIVALSDRIGTVDRRIELEDGSVFATGDNESADRLTGVRGGFFSRISSLEAFHPRLLAFLIAVVLLVVGFVRYGLPAAAQFAAWATPPKVVEIMDASALQTLERLFLSESKLDSEKREKLYADFERLVKASENDANYELLVRDGGPLGPNALALPAGTIVLTDQLVALGSHQEVVAVLAHEFSHVNHTHSLQQLYRALGFAAMVTILAGDLGTAGEEILGGGGLMVAMAASREMEMEADAEGVKLLRAIGGDPTKLSTMLDKIYEEACGGKLKGNCEETGWLSSHPGGEERREALRQAVEAF